MFKDPVCSGVPPKSDAVAIAFAFSGNDLYFARGDAAVNGSIDPSFVLAAYFLHEGWTGKINVTRRVSDAWKVAFDGIAHLAGSAQKLTLELFQPNIGKTNAVPGDANGYYEVALDGAAPATGQVLTAGDLFTPSGGGFFNLPRLYAMAALFIEHKKGSAVVALITNASGFIIAQGAKDYGDVGCGHAEVRAIFSILGQLPASGALFSTLKPCTMCAGLLHATSDANFRKYWARGDPSSGADWKKVNNLTLASSCGLSATTQTEQQVRAIKLNDDSTFTDSFSSAWTGRAAAIGQKAELEKAAFTEWRDANITQGRVLKHNMLRVVKDPPNVEASKSVASRVSAIGTADALSKRGDLFERFDKSAWKGGVDIPTSKSIVKLYTDGAQAKAVKKKLDDAAKASDMGIIKFISNHQKSTSLSSASHKVMAAKFAKYGKSAADVETVTGVKNAASTSVKPPSAATQQVVDYLFGFLKTQ